MNKIFFTVTTLLILAFSALFAAPYLVDWNEYRDVLERQASKAIGRKVKVAGKVDMRFLPTPFVRFSKVTIASEEGSFEQPFLSTKSFTMWLAITPLLKGTISARDMEIDGASITLKFDENGKPNWTDIGDSTAAFPWMPASVELHAVNISNSRLSVQTGGRTAPLVIDNLNGHLSAPDLKGPYKFSGSWAADGQERELKISTGAQDPSGAMKIKSLIRNAQTGASYNLDGEAIITDAAPTLAGVLTARVPPLLKSLPQTKERAEQSGFIEVKAGLDLNVSRALFNNVVISYERQSRPQIINGEAIVDWNRGINVTGQISAKLLDLDQILGGNDARAKPGEALSLLRHIIHDASPYVTRASIRALIEQTSLGGELVQSVDMQLSKSGDAFEIPSLKAELPGKNTLILSGNLTPHDKALGFSGPLKLKGGNLSRLMKWLDLGKNKPTGRGLKPYTIQAKAELAPANFSLRQVQGDFGGNAIRGSFNYSFADTNAISLSVDSDKLNLKEILGHTGSLQTFKEWMEGRKQEKGKQDNKSSDPATASLSANINLRIGQVILQDFEARNVLVNAIFKDGDIAVRNFNITSDGGLAIAANGTLEKDGAKRSSTLKLALEAREAVALKRLMELANLYVNVDTQKHEDLKSLIPINLGATIITGAKGTKGATAAVNGTAAGMDLAIRAKLEEGIATAKSSNLAVDGAISSHEVSKLVGVAAALASGKLAAPQKGKKSSTKGTLKIRLIGIPDKSLQARINLNGENIDGKFDGTIILGEESASAEGQTELKLVPTEEILNVVGLRHTPLRSTEPLILKGQLNNAGKAFALSDVSGSWGASEFKGDIKGDFSTLQSKFDVAIGVTKASFPHMLSFLTEHDDPAIDAPKKSAKTISFWPQSSFAKEALDDVSGEIRLGIGTLQLAENMPVQNAGLVAGIENGKLEVSLVSGKLYGGDITSTTSFSNDGAGLKIKGTMALKDAQLAALTAANTGAALASGPISANVEFAGQGLTPRGLISVLTGKGSLSIGKSEIFQLSPKAIPMVVGAAAEKQYEDAIATILLERFKESSFPVAPLTVPLKIAHGSVRTGQVPLDNKDTNVNVRSSLDLAALKLRSEWSLNAANTGKKKTQAPPVQLGFMGSLENFGKIKPIVDTKQLERFITVEQMERDVERLEELERQDRERAKRREKLRKEREKAKREEQRRLEQERIARERARIEEERRLERERQEQQRQQLQSIAPVLEEPIAPGPDPAPSGGNETIGVSPSAAVPSQAPASASVDTAPLDAELLPSRSEQDAAAQLPEPTVITIDDPLLDPNAPPGDDPLPETEPEPVRKQVRKKKDDGPNIFKNPINPFAN